jgi:hypothetical protein
MWKPGIVRNNLLLGKNIVRNPVVTIGITHSRPRESKEIPLIEMILHFLEK